MSIPHITVPEFRYRLRANKIADSEGNAVLVIPVPGRGLNNVRIERLIGAVLGVGLESQVLLDTFTRVVVNSWGTPDTGPTYSLVEGTIANFDTTGTQGTVTTATSAVQTMQSAVGRRDIDFSGTFVSLAGAPAISDNFSLVGRMTPPAAPTAWYEARAVVDGAFSVSRLDLIRGAPSTIGTTIASAPLAPVIPPPVSLRLALVGNVIRGTVWATGTQEPATPTVTATDAAITGLGGVGVRVDAQNANARTWTWDDLSAIGLVPAPVWEAYLNDPSFLNNIIDSSITGVLRWVPNIINGQHFWPGDVLYIKATGAPPGAELAIQGVAALLGS